MCLWCCCKRDCHCIYASSVHVNKLNLTWGTYDGVERFGEANFSRCGPWQLKAQASMMGCLETSDTWEATLISTLNADTITHWVFKARGAYFYDISKRSPKCRGQFAVGPADDIDVSLAETWIHNLPPAIDSVYYSHGTIRNRTVIWS